MPAPAPPAAAKRRSRARSRSLIRVHRNWLVNLAFARELERDGSETTLFLGASIGDESQGIRVPISRDRAQPLRNALLANATGVRRF